MTRGTSYADTSRNRRLTNDDKLYALVRDEIAPGTGIEPDGFWVGLGKIVRDLGPTNRRLLEKRNAQQRRIDSWCLSHRCQAFNVAEYQVFLETIGYLVRQGESFQAALDLVFKGQLAENGYT